MKNKLNNYFRVGILLFGISLLLLNCERDNFLESSQTEIAKSSFKVKTVKLSEIPQVRDYILDITNDNIFSKSTVVDGAIFDDDNILEVIDTLNYSNYTFRFVYPDTPIGTFYNLIVGKTPEGDNKTPYVLKYVCDATSLDAFAENNFDFNFFRGKVGIHRYTDFFELGSILKIDPNCPPSYDENGDPMPCDTEGVDGGSTGSGGGYGDGETADTGGDTSYNSTGDSNPGPDGSDSGSSGTSGSGSGGSGGASPCVTSECYPSWDDCQEYIVVINPDCLNNDGQIAPSDDDDDMSSKAGEDCPECPSPDGGVGVLPDISLCSSGLIKDEDGVCVTIDEIFINQEFKDNPCLNSVYESMGKASTFQGYLQNFEPEFSVAHLRFGYDENYKDTYDPEFWGALAITGAPQNFNINITFNGDANLEASIHNKSKLIIAVAFIHEMIHAETYRKMLSAAQQGDLNVGQYTIEDRENYINSLRNNFPGIYDYYVERWKPNWSHQQMAQHYIDVIISAISEYDNNQHTQEIYEALAWIGLKDTIAWNNLTQSERDTITQTRTNFEQNDTDKCD